MTMVSAWPLPELSATRWSAFFRWTPRAENVWLEPLCRPMIDFEQLVTTHQAALYRFGLSLAHSEATAADLTQQTFYLWAKKGHQLRDETKVKSWLFTTLYREHLSSRRHEVRFPHVELNDETENLPHEPAASFSALDGATVIATLERIDEAYRAVLTLFYLQDFSYREISEVLSIPIGTVMSRLSRGKAELRRLLVEKDGVARQNIVPLAPAAPRQP